MNKLVFRIIGALASSLIIVSVFVPFISAYGNFQSLWEANQTVGMVYIPIMIIVFGIIGVLGFAINIKTEFVYISFGAMLFYLIMETIPILKQGTFNYLGMGYYFLLIGTIIIGIMTFICKLNTRKKVKKIEQENNTEEQSILNQIDKLYDGDNSNVINMNTYPESVKPLSSVQNKIESYESEQVTVNPVMEVPQQAPIMLEPVQELNQNLVNPVVSEFTNQSMINDNIQNQIDTQIESYEREQVTVNPVIEVPQQAPAMLEPVQELNQNLVNPTFSQFNNQNIQNQNLGLQDSTEILFEQKLEESSVQNNNPVVSEFSNSIPQTFINPAPINSGYEIKKDEVQKNNSGNLDIFN